MPTVEIKWANRRDLCYTASIAREIDKREIIAAGPRNMTECGYITWEMLEIYGGIAWCAWVDGNPEFSFGFTRQSALNPHLFSAWAWGSDKIDVVMPELARWAKGGNGVPSLIDRLDIEGCGRIEARSIYEHRASHRWLEWLGFVKECELPEWGVGKERFVQYRWLRSEFAGFGKHGNVIARKGKHHVHGRRKSPATPAPGPGHSNNGQRGSHPANAR
jgi:hypothetical protein